MQLFGVDTGRFSPCGGGGIAPAGMNYLYSRPPSINLDQFRIYDDIRRPQYVPRYFSGTSSVVKYNALKQTPDILNPGNVSHGNYAAEFSTSAYCKNAPIRAHNYRLEGGPGEYVPNKALPGNYTGGFWAGPKDNPHLWNQKLYDYPIDNPILSHFNERYQHYLQGYADQLLADVLRDRGMGSDPESAELFDEYESEGSAFPLAAVRAIGHSLISISDAYARFGDEDSLEGMRKIIRAIKVMQEDSGAIAQDNEVSFQEGYAAHGILNAMMLVSSDHQIFRDGWAILFGGEGRDGKPGVVDAMMGSNSGYYTIPGCTDCGSSGTATTHIDPLAVSAYLLANVGSPYDQSTNPQKARNIITYLVDYLDDGINGGARPYSISSNWQQHAWNGDSYGRTCRLIAQWQNLDPTAWADTLGLLAPVVGGGDIPSAPLNLRVLGN